MHVVGVKINKDNFESYLFQNFAEHKKLSKNIFKSKNFVIFNINLETWVKFCPSRTNVLQLI